MSEAATAHAEPASRSHALELPRPHSHHSVLSAKTLYDPTANWPIYSLKVVCQLPSGGKTMKQWNRLSVALAWDASCPGKMRELEKTNGIFAFRKVMVSG